MKTCGTCKYWGSNDGRGDQRFRQCHAVIHDREGVLVHSNTLITPLEERSWLDPGERQRLIAIRDAAKACVIDGSGYFAALCTRETFGCVLHEGRE